MCAAEFYSKTSFIEDKLNVTKRSSMPLSLPHSWLMIVLPKSPRKQNH